MRPSASARSVVDFAELLLRSYELLERNEPLRHYQRRFRHILVDEFGHQPPAVPLVEALRR